MKLPRRNFLHLAASTAALPAMSCFAWAQTYPTRPVRLIAPFAPGGSTDIIARLMGQWLSERLGQQFVIDNRPGGGGNIGTEAVVRASPDGYTLLMIGSYNAVNATLYAKLNFDLIRDIAPVASVIRGAYVMVVNPSVPAKTVPQFIAYAKANPGRLTMASSGIGTPPHVIGELFKMMAGVNLVHVPYRGSGPALVDLLAGQVQVTFPSMTSSYKMARFAGICATQFRGVFSYTSIFQPPQDRGGQPRNTAEERRGDSDTHCAGSFLEDVSRRAICGLVITSVPLPTKARLLGSWGQVSFPGVH
jgi:tripartite-type tricarboxylate transporter receptor subunit TctC